MAYKTFILVALFATSALAQILTGGTCPNATGQKNIDFLKLVGTWYEQYRYATTAEVKSVCGTLNFQVNGTIIKATFKHVDLDTKQEVTQIAVGTFDANAGTLTLVFSFGPITYQIISTDYSYIVLYDCRDQLFWQNLKNAVILTREKFAMPKSLLPGLRVALNGTVEIDRFQNSAQYRCPLPRLQ